MLKQFMLADGKIDDIEVEEKYVRWTEQLRSDRYVTVPKHMMDTHTHTCKPMCPWHVMASPADTGYKTTAVQDLWEIEGGQAVRGRTDQRTLNCNLAWWFGSIDRVFFMRNLVAKAVIFGN